jgi:diketogulonate reductase-like aldo/keto reductase
MGNTDWANLDEELVKTIVAAIKAGYYHLDGAEGE